MNRLTAWILPFALMLTTAKGASVFSPLDQAPYNIDGLAIKTVANTHRVGGNIQVDDKSRAAVWDSYNKLQVMALPDGFTLLESKLNALSTDGTTATGTVTYLDSSQNTKEAVFRWQIGSVGELLPNTMDLSAHPSALSGDGHVIVGNITVAGNPVGFSYQANTRSLLVTPANAILYYVDAVSQDGTVMAGSAQFDEGEIAIVWRDGAPARLAFVEGYTDSSATAISGDGKVVAGYANGPKSSGSGTIDHGVIWNQAGVMTVLPEIVGWDSAIPTSVNQDGTVVTGYLERAEGAGLVYGAFIWDSSKGIRTLQVEFINTYGTDLSDGLGGNWSVEDPFVSPDGTFIYGTARDSEGVSTGFIFDTLDWRVYFRGSTVTGTDLIYCNWLQDFLYVPSYPIVWSTTHDWIYCPPNVGDSYWIYDWAMDSWWWTTSTIYPYLFQFGKTAETTRWLYYFVDSGSHPRYFADLNVVPNVIISYP